MHNTNEPKNHGLAVLLAIILVAFIVTVAVKLGEWL
ncbi:hypothetical protein SRABI91_01659 [Rhodococcoides fascians]|nr:hypothetical protein SRABI91_01659 [Rhodococcus fascians]